MSALVLSLSGIALTFGGDALLEDATLEVRPGARVALVGRNGSGKSTLLKIAAGMIEPDAGTRFVHPDAKVRYLPQEPDFGGHDTALAYAAAILKDPSALHLAERALEELGLNPETPLATASGGEAKRAAVAAVLAAKPDVILLDEPTNHLDIPAILQLEQKLAALNAAIVLISHDRRFLENLTTQTVWLDRGRTHYLSKGFKAFEDWRDKLLDEEKAARHKLGRKIAAEEDWVRYGVTARRKRNVRRMAELQAMRRTLREARRAPGAVKFEATDAEASGKRVIEAVNISKAYDDRKIVDGFSTKVARGEKIGLVAPNGAGKTTLLNMLTGQLAPDEGAVTLGTNIELVSLDQRRAALKPDMRLADAIADERGDWVTVGGAKKHVATYLQDFLFAPEQWRAPVSSLSGGERGRLALAAALAKPSNLLALDEPTNDLDLETLDLLEDLLANYPGTLLLISHDRSFLDRLVASVITTDPENPGGWRRYPGGYDDMVRQRGRAPGADKDAAPPEQSSKTATERHAAPKTAQTKLSYKEQFALNTLPDKIAALEANIATLNEALADPKLFEKDAAAFNEKAKALEAAKTELAAAEDQWLTLEAKREEIEGD
jgi:ATP-binding cassette subfamily F protein uup